MGQYTDKGYRESIIESSQKDVKNLLLTSTFANAKICTLAHYIAHWHLCWSFLIDLKKGVIPNDRVELDKKIDYVNESVELLFYEGTRLYQRLKAITPIYMSDSLYCDIDINRTLPKYKKASPLYYYVKLPYRESSIEEFYAYVVPRFKLFHLMIKDYFVQFDIENETTKRGKESDKEAWESIVALVKDFESIFKKDLK
jgi:hypothetical protein